MKIILVKMRNKGVALPGRMLRDRYTISYAGTLSIRDTTDQGLHRPVKIAKVVCDSATFDVHQLFDPHIVWVNENRFTYAGFERVQNEKGEVVEYAQSWLCTLALAGPPTSEPEEGPRYRR